MSLLAINYRDKDVGAEITYGAQSSLCIVGSMQIVWWCQYMSTPPRLAAVPKDNIEDCHTLYASCVVQERSQVLCICSSRNMRILGCIPDNR